MSEWRYEPTLDFTFNEPGESVWSTNFRWPPASLVDTVVREPTKVGWGLAKQVQGNPIAVVTSTPEAFDIITATPWGEADVIWSNTSLDSPIPDAIGSVSTLKWGEFDNKLSVVTGLVNYNIQRFLDNPTILPYSSDMINVDVPGATPYIVAYPLPSVVTTLSYELVDVHGFKPAPFNYRYVPTLDFDFTPVGESKWTTDFQWPYSQDQRRRLYPISENTSLPTKNLKNPIDLPTTVPWEFSIDNFIVADFGVPHRTDDDAIDPPDPHEPIVHPDYEVFSIVNTVNIKVMPEGTFIEFTDFNIQRDIDSFVWTVAFNCVNQQSFDLVKPVGRTLKTIEIEINNLRFTCFVGKTNTGVGVDSSGKVSRSFKCTGWSNLKLLSYPYSAKRSNTVGTGKTAAQLVNDELLGSGITSEWLAPDWLVPANVHSYQDKTPMGAILDITNSIGAVVDPHPHEQKIRVRPYFPVNPWAWSTHDQIDHTIHENQFYTIDTDNIPKENPDLVFVYGVAGSSVGAKVRRVGTPGLKPLPDVVNKYMTHLDAAKERGRMEIAKNSFIETIPMSIYVDTNVGVFNIQDLIEFTTPSNDKWVGMVTSQSITCARIGTALVQQITVARFHDE